jgi:hypothetical protein
MVYLGLFMTMIMGLSVFSMYSWIYSPTKATFADYENLMPTEQVFGAAEKAVVTELPESQITDDPREDELFTRKVNEVRGFLEKYKAPLAANAEDFVRAADIYKIDYRLLPSISIVESSGGKHLFKPYNPFGWGKWGYPNFTAAIYDVSRGMSRYYARGADTPEEIARTYNPVTPKEWSGKVRKLTGQMPAL